MDMAKHPQLQATKHVTDFVYDNDTPKGLLIVYYAGHGWAENNSVGRISLSGKFPDNAHERDESIEWNEVEHSLSKATSDVLVIFDCCHAGLLCRPAFRGHRRSFYYVAACKGDQVTRSSGKRSFTKAMIWALEELAGNPRFTVTKLISTLMKYEHFPRDHQEPVIYPSRFGPGDHEIWIIPTPRDRAKGATAPVQDHSPNIPTTTDILDLRFHFTDHATSSHIHDTAVVLKDLLNSNKHLYFHRISFVDHSSFVEGLARRWLQTTRKKKLHAKDGATPLDRSPTIGNLEIPSNIVDERFLGPPADKMGNNTPLSPASTTVDTSLANGTSPVLEQPVSGKPVRNHCGVLHHLGMALTLLIEMFLPASVCVVLHKLFGSIKVVVVWAYQMLCG